MIDTDEARPTPDEVQHAVASLDGPAADLWCEMLAAGVNVEALRWTDSDEHDRRLAAQPEEPSADLVIPEAGRTAAADEDDAGFRHFAPYLDY